MRNNLTDKEMAMYKPCERIVGENITHGVNCVCKKIKDEHEQNLKKNENQNKNFR